MPTESPDNTDGHPRGGIPSPFDPEAARAASLRSMLACVRRRARMRRTMDATAAALIIGIAVQQALWNRQPASASAPRHGITAAWPQPKRQPTLSESLIFSTPPDADVERIVPVAKPGLLVRSQVSPALAVHTPSGPGSLVPRLSNDEFHQLLAHNGVYLIRVGDEWPRVLPFPQAP